MLRALAASSKTGGTPEAAAPFSSRPPGTDRSWAATCPSRQSTRASPSRCGRAGKAAVLAAIRERQQAGSKAEFKAAQQAALRTALVPASPAAAAPPT